MLVRPHQTLLARHHRAGHFNSQLNRQLIVCVAEHAVVEQAVGRALGRVEARAGHGHPWHGALLATVAIL